MAAENIVRLETVYVCPDCGNGLFQVIETFDSGGPVCRCIECGWCKISSHENKLIKEQT